MSNFKKLLIPAVILVVLVGAFLIVTNLPQPEKENNTPVVEKIEIFNFVKDDLTDIFMEGQDVRFHFNYATIQVEEETVKEDGTTEKKLVDRKVWQAIEPQGMKVNTSTIDSIAWNANTLKAQKIIEENPSDLAVYGLNNARKLTFQLKDGTKHVLFVGNETPTGGAYYVKKENEPKVYTIGSYEGEKFKQSKFDMMVTDLYEAEYTPEDFSIISFSRKGQKVFDAAFQNSRWMLSYPINAEAHSENVYNIAASLSGISIQKYVEENVADLQKYGLSNPAYSFDFTVSGLNYKLSLGDKVDNSFYAIINDGKLVFTIAQENFTFLDKPIEEIVSAFVHLQNIQEVSEMRITMDGVTDISKINVDKEDDEKSTYDFNGTVLSGEADDDYIKTFKKYYQGAIGLLVDKIVLDVQPALENPDVTIEYTLKSGEKIVVQLVSAPDGVSYYAFKNGQYTGMTLRKQRLENDYYNGLRKSRPNLVEALKERSSKQ